MQTQLLVIEHKDGKWQPAWIGEHSRCLDPHQVTGWPAMLDAAPDMELDPEEILAEQFAGLVTEEHVLPLTGIRAALQAVLASQVLCNLL